MFSADIEFKDRECPTLCGDLNFQSPWPPKEDRFFFFLRAE